MFKLINNKTMNDIFKELEELFNPDKNKFFLAPQEPTEDKICCKGCGSTNVRMTDYSPLAMEENLLPIGQFDNELYAEFKCFDCETSFQKVLKISI